VDYLNPKRFDSVDDISNHGDMICIKNESWDHTWWLHIFPWDEHEINPLGHSMLMMLHCFQERRPFDHLFEARVVHGRQVEMITCLMTENTSGYDGINGMNKVTLVFDGKRLLQWQQQPLPCL
jgi:hypothetical protein